MMGGVSLTLHLEARLPLGRPRAPLNLSCEVIMFLHRKELIQPVNVGTPDAAFGQFLLEQFGRATGELTAALHPPKAKRGRK